MKWRWTLALVAVCAALVAVLAKGFGLNPHAVPFMLEGKPAPGFTLPTLDSSKAVSLDQLKGKPVVINFWASWCGPCKLEHSVLNWGARQFGDQVHFLGVVFEDTEDNAREFLREHGSTFPQLVDARSRTAVDYGAAGVPETYFIDAQGVIANKFVGPINSETLRTRIQELISKTTVSP